MIEPLKLAIVGHTNAGKTSLMRTLLRDVDFGEVSHRSGTTRHVEGARLFVQGEALLELYDTPGLEDAIALCDYIDALKEPKERLDGPSEIDRFLATTEARQRFEQEAKVLRQLMASDAGVYVIDVREPRLAKYRDELAILTLCGKPLLPVLNFVAQAGEREHDWRETLAHHSLHAVVAFDSIAPPLDGERRLYDSLALLLEKGRRQLVRLIDDHQQQRRTRIESGCNMIAELLIDVAACRRSVSSDATQEKQALDQLLQDVRTCEQRCVDMLLKLYAFRPDDARTDQLPLLDGRWASDLFSPESLRQVGIQLSSGIVTGATFGIAIDLMAGGLTLGVAAGLGALIGGVTQVLRHHGGRLINKIKGEHELSVDDAILCLLAVRQMQLLTALDNRGHAASQTIEISATDRQKSRWHEGKLPKILNQARAHPEWSALNVITLRMGNERQNAIATLSKELPQINDVDRQVDGIPPTSSFRS